MMRWLLRPLDRYVLGEWTKIFFGTAGAVLFLRSFTASSHSAGGFGQLSSIPSSIADTHDPMSPTTGASILLRSVPCSSSAATWPSAGHWRRRRST